MSGLEETGVLSDDVFQQTLVSRCGGLDVFDDHTFLVHSFKVLRYHIQQYPDPETSLSELTREEIDEVILAASQQWTDPSDKRPRLVRSDSKARCLWEVPKRFNESQRISHWICIVNYHL